MLSIDALSYRIGPRPILESASLSVLEGWRVGLVGRNGAGKSTLFRLITGDLAADSGRIQLVSGRRIGQVRQDLPDTDAPLIDLVIQGNPDLAAVEQAIATEQDPSRLADLYARRADLDADAAPSRAATLLTGLGFSQEQLQAPFNAFSGGWRMRVMLAAALFAQPDLLLLDEPTNHLDLEAIIWLESYLASYPKTLLIISHDRALLNLCTNHIAHLENGGLTLYRGNYDSFERERALARGVQQRSFERQQAERARLQAFIDRFKAKASKASQAQSRVKALERMDLVEAVIADRAIRFSFPDPEPLANPMLSLQKLEVGYTPERPILRRVSLNIDFDDRIALLGANGNGKSTMMKLLAGELSPLAGQLQRSGKLRIGYFSQYQTDVLEVRETPLTVMGRLLRTRNPEVRETEIRSRLARFGFGPDLADSRIQGLSGGEKARLLFALIAVDQPHLLLLDEPTNHLDMESREALVAALNEFAGAVVIVSHDPMLLERVVERLWLVEDGTVQPFEGDVQAYRSHVLARRRDQRREARSGAAPKLSAAPAPVQKPQPVAQRRIATLEAQIAGLQRDKRALEKILSDPKLYGTPLKLKLAQEKYAEVTAALDAAETEWLEATL